MDNIVTGPGYKIAIFSNDEGAVVLGITFTGSNEKYLPMVPVDARTLGNALIEYAKRVDQASR